LGLKNGKFFVADLGSSAFLILRDRKILILDPGSGINIPNLDKHPVSATVEKLAHFWLLFLELEIPSWRMET
jgi:hypothetical protein